MDGYRQLMADQLRHALDALKKTGEDAVRIGHVTATPGKSVSIPARGLTGTGDTFTQAG